MRIIINQPSVQSQFVFLLLFIQADGMSRDVVAFYRCTLDKDGDLK